MAFPRKLLNGDEEIVLDLRPHWWFLLPKIVAVVASIGVGIVAMLVVDFVPVQILAALVALAAAGWLAVTYAEWTTTNFVVTTDRLIYRSGVIAKQGIEIPLERVNNVIFNQSVFERMLGAGDLLIESAGESGQQTFSDIARPSAVQNEIYRAIEENQNRMYDRIGSEARDAGRQGSRAAPGDSITDQIDRLHQLMQQGAISEAEYESKKADLLDRL